MPFAQYFDRLHSYSEARSFIEKWLGRTENGLEIFVENLPSVLERGLLVRRMLLEQHNSGKKVENAEEETKDDDEESGESLRIFSEKLYGNESDYSFYFLL